MTGFLTTIAARSVAASAPPAIRPRSLSLFEPVRHEPDLEEREAPPDSRRRVPELGYDGDRPPVTVLAYDEPRPVLAAAGERGLAPEPQEAPRDAALVAHRVGERDRRDAAAADDVTDSAELEPPTMLRERIVVQDVVAVPIRVGAPAGQQSSTPLVQQDDARPDRVPEPSRVVSPVPREQVLRLESSGERRERDAVRRPALAAPPRRRGATDAGLTLRTEPASPQRDVQVTIGRVEIRAVQEQAPRQPRRLAMPEPMSLDSYLRQRTHGVAR